MAALVLAISDCDPVELDILKNVPFNGLLELSISYNADEKRVFILAKRREGLIQIRSLIKSNYFNLERIRNLLENIYFCQTELKEHLLRPTQIDFNQDNIFYNEKTQKYQFLYNPCKDDFSSDMERYLIQDLLIHAKALDKLQYLFQSSYCIQSLIIKLNKVEQKKTIFNYLPFQPNKKSSIEKINHPLLKDQTITPTHKASLISKENHNDIFKLPFSVNSIGRGSHCNVYIHSPTLSLEHAVISLIQGKYFIKDNQSKNGTFVDGVKVENSTVLSSGNIIKFGEKEFIFIL